ncbi:MAG: non-canonical purine NTP pyrophosphatase, partial [Sutterellaceae bacterium]|nr:non-canonical purine NTP pyrophosphatase [Sutterellaceae bacterium]
MEKKLVLASNNKGKIREFNALFGTCGIEVVSQGSLGVASCEEPFFTFLENALQKARHASKETGLPAMADDSGITAHALVTEPGVYSARYAGEQGDDAANNAKL